MSKWEMVRLGELSEVITKGTTPTTLGYCFQDEGINFLKVESIEQNGNFLYNKIDHISKECDEKLKRSRLKEHDLLFSIAGALGRTAIVTKAILPANLNQALSIIRLHKDQASPKYIQYVLKSVYVFQQFQKQKQGVAQLNLSLKNISDLIIPLPPLEVQKKIANTLDTASELIALRKKQLEELDNLIKSTFYEMFGDPVTNEKGWIRTELDEVCEKITDGEHSTPRRSEKGIYLLSARNIHNHEIKLSDVDFIDLDEYERISKRIIPMENDILISCSGSVGRVCRVKGNFKFQMVRSVAILKLKSNINSVFIEYLIDSSYVQKQISRSINKSSQANLFQGKIKKLEIILPPLSFQNQFAEIVTKIEEQKFLVQKAIDESQYLFDSLMSEYFE